MTAVDPHGGLRPRPGCLRGLARRAFVEPPTTPEVRYRHRGAWCATPPRLAPSQLTQGQLGPGQLAPSGAEDGRITAVLVPSLAASDGTGSLAGSLAHLAVSLEHAERAGHGPFVLAVALQDRLGASRRDAQLEELEGWWSERSAVPFVGLSVSMPSKLLALAACIPLLDAAGATRVAWFDDDVEVEPGCVAALLAAYDPAFPGIYGARKVAVGDRTRFSAWWSRRKNHKEPVNLYPHGCAMLMARRTFGDGVPTAYITDDHYYLFRFLDPAAPDPLHALRVVPQAVVRVPSVNSPVVFLRRTARNYRNLQRVLADAPTPTARCFFRLHFPGLRAPRSVAEAISPRYWGRLAGQLPRRALWVLLRLEVLARGLARRPRHTLWYSAPQPHVLRERSTRA